MNIVAITDLREAERIAEAWNELAGDVPLRRSEWMLNWWRHIGSVDHQGAANALGGTQLFVLAVYDDEYGESPVAIAPFYRERTALYGNAIRFLGSGIVCTDYQSILCRPYCEAKAASRLAAWLHDESSVEWDLVELAGVAGDDLAVTTLAQELSHYGHHTHTRRGENCWRLELPSSWDAYLALLSKGHRKQVRRIVRDWFDSGRAEYRRANTVEELPSAFRLLIHLHQSRRRSLSQPGCFSTRGFQQFLLDASYGLLANHRAQLSWLELDGLPAAIDYNLDSGAVIYSYQGGIDPRLLDEQPGRLLTIATIRKAIKEGYHAVDFLRGDEPYKAHMRARPVQMSEFRVVHNRASAKLRHRVWQAKEGMRRWAKRSLGRESTQDRTATELPQPRAATRCQPTAKNSTHNPAP